MSFYRSFLRNSVTHPLGKGKILVIILLLSLLFVPGGYSPAVLEAEDYTIGAKTSMLSLAQIEYVIYKTDQSILVDGRLDEDVW